MPGDRAKLRPHRVASDCQFWTVAQPSVGTPGMEESVLHAGGHRDSLGEQLRPSCVIRVCVCNTNASYMSVCGLQGVWGVLRQCSKRVALCFIDDKIFMITRGGQFYHICIKRFP